MASPSTSQSSLPPPGLSEKTLVPTTDEIAEACPRFRILIVGRTGTGKSSLINATFKASLADVQHDQAGDADINKGITSEYNEHLILHDSQGYEPGSVKKFGILSKFIQERSRKDFGAERLHAIWLCIPVPYAGGRIFETGDEMIFQLNRNKVPIIIVFTKFDLFIANVSKGKAGNDKSKMELATKAFKERFKKSLKKIKYQISYTLVSVSLPQTLQQLVKVTMKSLAVEIPIPLSGPARYTKSRLFNKATENDGLLDQDLSDPVQIALAIAQRVDMTAKNAASIKVGKMKYWIAIASGVSFLNISLKNCLYAIHKDIVIIWNIRDLHEFLLSHEFHRKMMYIVDDLHRRDQANDTAQRKKTTMAGLAEWMSGIYQNFPEHVRCLMGYVVDLTLILQAVFQVSLEDHLEGKVTPDRVIDIIYEFETSKKKRQIHDAIWSFVEAQYPFAKNNVVDKIESLLDENEMTKDDIQLDKKRTPLESLLTLVKSELAAGNSVTLNQITLDLMRRVLDSPDYGAIASELDNTSDIETLFDFIFYQVRNGSLTYSGIQEANQKARTLMLELISENVLPQSLYITNVSFDADHGLIGIGGHGRVLKGKYEGQVVALKMLDNFNKGQKGLFQEFWNEALVWRTLRHDFILPLLGIFKERKVQFLVSPFMPNGTLMEWRRNIKLPSSAELAEIHRLILEVAEGVQYLHSEGVVHGDIKGDNVLLDSQLHCKIVDFGLTRHSDATATETLAYTPHYAAPELFRKCSKCNKLQCNGCRGEPE
ncbi:hypothetical protein F5887DRAFT_614117 [Amanita rubescens]|nr:hypothetical protein F5887DRAFT_614117 [Amanita rubescens]